ncbi:MAG: branched-chain amino acid ABC transporter permease, partial [Chloroflexi bacterium]
MVLALLLVLLGPRAASDPSFFVQIVIYGLANGAIYALIALGY